MTQYFKHTRKRGKADSIVIQSPIIEFFESVKKTVIEFSESIKRKTIQVFASP